MNDQTAQTADDAQQLRRAAAHLRSGAPIPPNIAPMLADLLDGEAAFIDGLEPFVNLLNVGFELEGGGKAYLKLDRTEAGELRVWGDSTGNAVRLARMVTVGGEADR